MVRVAQAMKGLLSTRDKKAKDEEDLWARWNNENRGHVEVQREGKGSHMLHGAKEKGRERVCESCSSFVPRMPSFQANLRPHRLSLPPAAVRRTASLLPTRRRTSSPPPSRAGRLALRLGRLIPFSWSGTARRRRAASVLCPPRNGSHSSTCAHRPPSSACARTVRAGKRVGERLLARRADDRGRRRRDRVQAECRGPRGRVKWRREERGRGGRGRCRGPAAS